MQHITLAQGHKLFFAGRPVYFREHGQINGEFGYRIENKDCTPGMKQKYWQFIVDRHISADRFLPICLIDDMRPVREILSEIEGGEYIVIMKSNGLSRHVMSGTKDSCLDFCNVHHWDLEDENGFIWSLDMWQLPLQKGATK